MSILSAIWQFDEVMMVSALILRQHDVLYFHSANLNSLKQQSAGSYRRVALLTIQFTIILKLSVFATSQGYRYTYVKTIKQTRLFMK